MSLSRDIQNAQCKAGNRNQLDEHCKRVLASKPILARILWHTMKEYQDISYEEVMDLIEGKIEISTIHVNPGETNAEVVATVVNHTSNETAEYITGIDTEDKVQNEGSIRYDIRFQAYQPTVEGQEKILVDVEGQKKFDQKYIEARSVFYSSRMISAQLGREFQIPNYKNIKKVYSIWICMNAPKRIGNAISEIKLEKKHLFRKVSELGKAYDKISIILICLNNSVDNGNELTDMLNVLFAKKIGCEEKTKILAEQYGLPMEDEFVKEMNIMCNISEYFIEEGLKEGRKRGLREGRRKGIKEGRAEGRAAGRAEGRAEGREMAIMEMTQKLLQDGSLSEEKIMAIVGIAKEKINKIKADIVVQ